MYEHLRGRYPPVICRVKTGFARRNIAEVVVLKTPNFHINMIEEKIICTLSVPILY